MGRGNVQTTLKECPVKITTGAVVEFKRLMNEKEIPKHNGLRIGVKGGGCAGFSYILGFDEKKTQDEEFGVDGLKIFMEKAHQIYLSGVTIDYKDDLDSRGFVFENPNASSTCGCGSSFAS